MVKQPTKVILITGVSSGFGKATAGLLAQRGYKVYGTIRREADVDPAIRTLYLDLTDKTSIQSAVQQVMQHEGRVDVLINNANMHLGGPAEYTPIDDYQKQMDTGFGGTVCLIRQVLPIMRAQGGGLIINISSIGGLMGLPFQSFYSAGKFAVEGFSEALRMEVRPFSIRVVVVNPGDFNTSNTANRINIKDCGNYSGQFEKTLAVIEHDETRGKRPEVLAHKLVRIVESRNPRHRYIVGAFDQRLAVFLKRVLPSAWFDKILRSHYGIK